MEAPSRFASDVADAFTNQIDYCRANDAPITGAVVAALAQLLDDGGGGAFLEAVRRWQGSALADGLPLRCAGALHGLHLSGEEPALAPLYAGEEVDVVALLRSVLRDHAETLLPWLDGPPQTNEAGRSANFVAAMLWLADRGLPATFECLEIGSSAGINLMIDRYAYDLAGVRLGPEPAVMTLSPDWKGPPPPSRPIVILPPTGCDVAPLDLGDPAQALRLKAFVWPEHHIRFARIEAAIAAAHERAPDLVRANAADFMEDHLARPQAAGTTRVLMHSIVWQYVPEDQRERITAAMEAAGAAADETHALAWIAVEADRTLMRHTLKVRYWPRRDGGEAPVLLANAHAHGAHVEWLAR